MAYWQTYYHLVWATKERQPFITTQIEDELYGYIKGKAHDLGCIVQAVGGVQDHIHTIMSIPPKLSVAEVVKQLKGSSSYHLTHAINKPLLQFGWQLGYGVFSLEHKQLAKATNYVQSQKQHHQEGTTIKALEYFCEEDKGPSE